ncbi:MAG TPA: CPBP family intramembrane metalloprotease [Anaerolineae bacterium]|nr:CPBP family intramembrane metalloprotease [Anaerolineae bacterium]
MSTLAAWFLLLTYLAFAYSPWRAALSQLNKRLGDWTVGFLLIPFLLASAFQPDLGDIIRVLIFLTLPTLLLRLRPERKKPFDLFHVLAILAIWVPIEPDLFVLVVDFFVPGVDLNSQLTNLSLLPSIDALLLPGVHLPVQTLIAVALALYLFLVRYPLNGVGFTFQLGIQDFWNALRGLLAYSVFGLPIGLGIQFLHYNPAFPGLVELLLGALGGYLLIALIEEVLFRGLIQNLLSERMVNKWVALVAASLIFGVAHLNNTTAGYSTPNWAYALMATMAGVAYGWVWMRTGKVTASALTHMLVNLIWGTLFA